MKTSAEYMRDWRKKNPARDRLARIKRQFGVTPEADANMRKQQNNCCAICKKEFTETPQIDHSHTCCAGQFSCGKCVRGLLCGTCNKALGGFGDCIGTVRSALDYLIFWRSAHEGARDSGLVGQV